MTKVIGIITQKGVAGTIAQKGVAGSITQKGVTGIIVSSSAQSWSAQIPTGLTATAMSSTRVDLAWTNVDSTGDGVKVERSDDNGDTYSVIATVALPDNTYSNTGLTVDTISLYRVRAYKGANYSEYSNIATGDLLSYGMTAYWKMNESAGDAIDEVSGLILTNNNSVTYVAGYEGNAASLGIGNTNKTLQLNSNFGLTYASSRSLTGRFRILSQPAVGGAFALLSIIWATNPGNYTTIIYRNSLGVSQITTNGGGGVVYISTLTIGTWYNFCITHDHAGNVIKLYLDAQLIITDTSFASDYSAQTSRLSVGDIVNGNFASVVADDIKLFPRIITEAGTSASFDNNADNLKGILGSVGYCWFARPRALYNSTANKTWICVVHNGGTGYSQHILTIDNATNILTKFRVGTAVQADDHNEPSLLVRSADNKLFTCYSEHTGAYIRKRISTNALDASAWGAETTVAPESPYTYTYPSCFQVANGDIYIFYRVSEAVNTYWSFIKSTDGGATFGAATRFSAKTYHNIIQNESNKDLIHIMGSQHPNESANPNNVNHFYFNAGTGTWHKSDGTDVTVSLPLTDANQTSIFNHANPEQGWIEDIALDVNGYPRVLMTYIPDNSADPCIKYLYYSEWNGSAWSTPYQIHQSLDRTIASGGSEKEYPPLSCFDRANTDRIFASKDVLGVCEIFEITRVSASSFTSVQKTFNNTFDQWRPFTVANSVKNVFWLNKTRYYFYANDFAQRLMNETF